MTPMGTLKTEIDPADVGFDAARLEPSSTATSSATSTTGCCPGWLLTVSRHGQLAHVSTYGQRDVEAGLPVETDTIWRIYSMTKPITAVAALVAWEQGLFELNDPVRRYIPSFADTKVWRSGSFTVAPVLEPITEEMRIWHLFAHTSGLTYGFMQNHPVDALYRQAGFEWGIPESATDLAEHLSTTSPRCRCVFQPGTEWQYSMGLDVLGRVIEVVAGVPFDEFLQTHVLDPLGMTDTVLARRRRPRRPPRRAVRPDARQPARRSATTRWARGRRRRRSPRSAAAGCAPRPATTSASPRCCAAAASSTACASSPRSTVELMASNHLPGDADLTAFGRPLFAETTFDGVGFGLGVSVTIDPVKAKVPGSVGDFGWGGAASTSFWVDPVEDLTVVFMTQLLPSSTHPIRSQLKQLVHSALVAPER